MVPKIFTTSQAAELCNSCDTSIKRYIRDGKLQAFKTPGGHYRITEADMFNFMNHHNIPIPDAIERARKKILVVDDDKQVREAIARFLKITSDNFDVETADDGFEAGVLVTQFKPDLLILDLMMPRMDGFAVCEKIRSIPAVRDIMIVVLTGFATEENIHKAIDSGADIVLSKPLENEELLNCIEKLLELK